WRLAKIDGERDVVVGTADLPLQARHVTAVPGVDRWAFVEKGAVQNFGVQDAQSLYFLPADELRGNLAGALCR
ncbi:MAG TPA: hypothetical protein VFI63_01340, partial [Solirubrobacterales bacterium]|nr:hypothetical protein [Solirubrobacterales bacterium]